MENIADIVNTCDISLADVDETLRCLKESSKLISSASSPIQNVLRRRKNGELQTSKGLSFLELKVHLNLQYVMNLTHIIMQKSAGKKIENDPAIERLVTLRIYLEKMRPIEEKLKYQINKLQSAVTSGNFDESDPLRFRANPENLNVENEDETQDEKIESKVYVPPKISAAYFEEDDTIEARKKKILERSKMRALSSNMIYELRKEYDTGPEEIKETIDPYKIKLNEEMKERARYEEEYMTRLPMTKKQKHEARQLMTVSNFNMKFDDISALDMGTEDVSLKRRSSGKKGKFSRKTGKGKGKKKRKY